MGRKKIRDFYVLILNGRGIAFERYLYQHFIGTTASYLGNEKCNHSESELRLPLSTNIKLGTSRPHRGLPVLKPLATVHYFSLESDFVSEGELAILEAACLLLL